MTEPNWLEKAGASPAKLATVGVLTFTLVSVIWHNASDTLPTKTRQTTPQNDTAKKAAELSSAKNKPLAKQVRKEWPKIALSSVIKHDPFAKPMWYLTALAEEYGTADGSLARSAQVIEELKKQQSRIVVITDENRMAMIGELSLRVGDTIEGFQVTEITTEGIVLTELPR